MSGTNKTEVMSNAPNSEFVKTVIDGLADAVAAFEQKTGKAIAAIELREVYPIRRCEAFYFKVYF